MTAPHELTVKRLGSKKKMVLLLVRTATFNKEWLEGVLQLWGPQLTISWHSLANILHTETFKSTIHLPPLNKEVLKK